MDDTREIVWYAEGSATIATQPLAAGTYYAELASMPGRGHCHQFDWDAVLVAVVTFEATLKSTGPISAVAGRSWDPATGLGTVNIPGGAVGVEVVDVVDGEATRLRAKAVVGTQGELLGRTR